MVDTKFKFLPAQKTEIFHVGSSVAECWSVAIILVYEAAMLLLMLLILSLPVKIALLVRRCA
jgi:hypothetical protein